MPKVAYSYIRFSTEHQREGNSLERQLEATRAYCERNNLVLDESQNLCDLGVSAFEGRNAQYGSLGRFIDLCERGEIAPGSALVVESLDRITRTKPRRAVRLLDTILDLGIEIHLTMAGKVFRPGTKDDSGTQEGIDMIMAIAMAMRSHEESETKSRRLREAFKKKRQRAEAGECLVSKTVPWWLTIEGGKIVIIPERTAIVERIFKMTAEGVSSQKIARQLNKENIPTWRRKAKEWQDSRIRDTIRYDAALGHLTQTPKTKPRYRIENYYPRVISDDLAAQARSSMKENLVGAPRKPQPGKPQNLFRGLLYHRGRWCRFQSQRNGLPNADGVKGYHGYYDDHNPNKFYDTDPKLTIDQVVALKKNSEANKARNRIKKKSNTWSIAASQLEPVIVHCLSELSPEDLLPEKKAPHRSIILRARVQEIERKISNIHDALADGAGKSLHSKLAELETALAENRRELARAEIAEKPRSSSRSLLKSISTDLSNLESRSRTALAIRRLISRIDVGSTFEDVGISTELYDAWIDKTVSFDEPSAIVTDPVPFNKRRKELTILITFKSGAQRIISRLDYAEADNIIYTARIDRDEDRHHFPPYPASIKPESK